MIAGRSQPGRLRSFWEGLDASQRRTLLMMGLVVGALHVLGFVTLFALIAPSHYRLGASGSFTIGIGITAYTLGMRHAFDADHISAIDNTTRKLMSEGKRPLSVGFWFSLGHSSVVFALAFLISLGVRSLDGPVKRDHSSLHQATGWIGTTVSGTFLYVIAGLNIIILIEILRSSADEERQIRRGGARAAAQQPWVHEPLLRTHDARRSPRPSKCGRSGCCAAPVSTPPPRSRCW